MGVATLPTTDVLSSLVSGVIPDIVPGTASGVFVPGIASGVFVPDRILQDVVSPVAPI
jgi:hypothetical protein